MKTIQLIPIADKLLQIEQISGTGIRWAVGQPNGPRGSTWRLWGNKKGDVYLAARNLGGQIKVSFHRDRRCHVGFTSEYAETAKSRFGFASRHWHRWVLPDGPTARAMQIVLPHSELRHFPSVESNEMKWLPAPSLDHVLVVTIFIAEPGAVETWPAAEQGALPLAFFKSSNRIAWVVFRENKIDCESKKYIKGARLKMQELPIDQEVQKDRSLRGVILGNKGENDNFFLELAGPYEENKEDVVDGARGSGLYS